MLELAHQEDRPRLRSLLSNVVGSRGAFRVRLRDASGDWTTAEFTIRRILEGPDDTGLVVANVRTRSTGR